MARPGVTKNDVFQAAIQIAGQGKYPTIADVRQLLGTGSNSTIAGYMKEWHASQSPEAGVALSENVPAELVSVLKGLWQRVQEMAQQEVNAISEKFREELQDYSKALSALKTEHHQLQQQEETRKKDNIHLTAENKTLQTLLQDHEQALQSLQMKLDASQDALSEKQTRINELKELHQKAQDNLEHYRESVREQRLIDQTRFEETLAQKESALQCLQQKSVNDQSQIASLIQSEKQAIFENHAMKDEIKINQEKVTEMQNKYLTSEIQLSQLKNQCHALENKLSDKEHALANAEKNAAVYFEQLQNMKTDMNQLTEANKILADQKLELAQEKAGLQGQLRQMNAFLKESA